MAQWVEYRIHTWIQTEQSLYPVGTDDYTDSSIISALSSLIIYFNSFQFSVAFFIDSGNKNTWLGLGKHGQCSNIPLYNTE